MANYEAQNYIVTNGLVLNLDAGDPDSYTRSQPPYVEVLVVAGGGSGGPSVVSLGGGGGGGAGGVIYNSAYQLTSAAAITVTVGAGGAGASAGSSQGNDGSNSVFGSLTAIGGGGGGSGAGTNTGRNGGSGGGAGYNGYYNNFNSGTGITGQGFRGGYVLANNNGGGGGGAGGEGGDTFDSRPEPGYPAGNGGLGGPGVYYSISGTSTLYSTGGNGGSNGANTIVSGSGTKGSYGGEGGTSTAATGIVIVRYPGLPAATGGTITYVNGYTIHTFTSSGTFTPYKWNDISGQGRTGNLVNGVSFIPNRNGGYLSFDGTDDYVDGISNSGITHGTNNFSYFAWVNLQGKPTYGTIFENGSWTSCLLIRYETNGITIYSMGSYWGKFTFNPSLSTWNHLGFVRNGNFIDFYINGVYQTALGFTANISPSSNIFIGTSQHATNQCFNGYIPVAQIYTRALSPAEITQNFNAQRARFGI